MQGSGPDALSATPHPIFGSRDPRVNFHIKTVPATDGWNNVWVFASDTNGTKYTITIYTKDGIVDGTSTGGMTSDFNCDIVFASGQFFEWPQGTQT